MTATNGAVLKPDRRGRLRYSPGQRSALVDAYQSSGPSGPRFAAIRGEAYQTLADWLLNRKKPAWRGLAGPPHSGFLSFVAAELNVPPPTGAPMEICLPGGAKPAIPARGQIPLAAALLRELASPRRC